jgi:hypothetical protein
MDLHNGGNDAYYSLEILLRMMVLEECDGFGELKPT